MAADADEKEFWVMSTVDGDIKWAESGPAPEEVKSGRYLVIRENGKGRWHWRVHSRADTWPLVARGNIEAADLREAIRKAKEAAREFLEDEA